MDYKTLEKIMMGIKTVCEVGEVLVKNYYTYNTDPSTALSGPGNNAGRLSQYTTASNDDTYYDNY